MSAQHATWTYLGHHIVGEARDHAHHLPHWTHLQNVLQLVLEDAHGEIALLNAIHDLLLHGVLRHNILRKAGASYHKLPHMFQDALRRQTFDNHMHKATNSQQCSSKTHALVQSDPAGQIGSFDVWLWRYKCVQARMQYASNLNNLKTLAAVQVKPCI